MSGCLQIKPVGEVKERENGRHDDEKDEKRSKQEEGERRGENAEDDWDGEGKDADEEHCPRRDYGAVLIGNGLHQVEVMSCSNLKA